MKPVEQFAVEALNSAKTKGLRICRGGVVFEFDADKKPIACNGIGAMLLAANLDHLVTADGFKGDWPEQFCNAIEGATTAWMWRFIHGFDYGNALTFTFQKKKENSSKVTEEVIRDKVSAWAVKLSKQFREK